MVATVSMIHPVVQHIVIKIPALVAGICLFGLIMVSGVHALLLQNIGEENMIQHAMVCIQEPRTLKK